MKNSNSQSKAEKNYLVDIIAFLPFLLLLLTGIIMLVYHTGRPYEMELLNKDGHFWLTMHKVLAVISLVLITVHLIMHVNWLKKLFAGKLKNKHAMKNLTLFILFVATTLTAVFPWLILKDNPIGKDILGIHNKMGLVLMVFFAIHVINYFKWLVTMTKKVFFKHDGGK